MGPSVATEIILNSRLIKEFNVIHIDTADRRTLNTLGRIDLTNIYLAFRHYALLLQTLWFSDAALVYLSISQTSIGFLRDIPFVFLAKLFGKKVVLHLRGAYFKDFYNSSTPIMKRLIVTVLGRIDRMIVLGHSLRGLFDGLVSDEKLSVVPNGLDMAIEEKAVSMDEESPLVILFLSNLIETKGFWDVLRSIDTVRQKYHKARYVFAGGWMDEKDRVKAENYANQKKIEGSTEFKGPVKGIEKVKLLQNAHIFVFPTYYPMEGHPWVIVEAMAAGLPIISTDQGCIRECVVDGENGFIIPKRDPNAIAGKVIYLIENPEQRNEMGRKSRQLYEASFTEAHFVQGMIDAVRLTLDGQWSS
jgi:glycosyltransferase involved in cell wall biosynthesis